MLLKYDCSLLDSREVEYSLEGWPTMVELPPDVEFLENERKKGRPFSTDPFVWPFPPVESGGNIFEAIHLRIDDMVLVLGGGEGIKLSKVKDNAHKGLSCIHQM